MHLSLDPRSALSPCLDSSCSHPVALAERTIVVVVVVVLVAKGEESRHATSSSQSTYRQFLPCDTFALFRRTFHQMSDLFVSVQRGMQLSIVDNRKEIIEVQHQTRRDQTTILKALLHCQADSTRIDNQTNGSAWNGRIFRRGFDTSIGPTDFLVRTGLSSLRCSACRDYFEEKNMIPSGISQSSERQCLHLFAVRRSTVDIKTGQLQSKQRVKSEGEYFYERRSMLWILELWFGRLN